MKTQKIILLLFLFSLLSCSKSSTAPEIEKIQPEFKVEALRKIFLLDVHTDWQYAEFNHYVSTKEDLRSWSTAEELIQKLKETDDRSFRRAGILLLASNPEPEVENVLLDFFNNEEGIEKLNAARVLAYRENSTGLSYLKSCVSGNTVLTSSGFERNAAALAILLLNQDLPQEYREWEMADRLYLLY